MVVLSLALLWLAQHVTAAPGQDSCLHLHRPHSAVLPWELRAGDSVCVASQSAPARNHSDSRAARAAWIRGGTCHGRNPDEFCSYTKQSFRGGEGISVITTPERIDRIAGLAAFEQESPVPGGPSAGSAGPALYRQAWIPGKDIGLVATRPIRAGTRIMSQTPAVMADGRAVDQLSQAHFSKLLGQAVDMLPRHHGAQYLNLSTHDSAENYTQQVYKVFATNAFRTGVDDDGDVLHSVFVEVSRLNHDCRPNCGYYFDAATVSHKVYALRDIMPGEEITLSYIDPIQPRRARRMQLNKHWGFDCACETCSAEAHLAEESDARIAQVKQLWEELDDYSATSTASPGKAELLVTLYQLEGLLGRLHEAHYRAALEWNGVGKPDEAARHARLCLDGGLLLRGPGRPFIESMKELLEKAEAHWSWRLRLKEKEESPSPSRG